MRSQGVPYVFPFKFPAPSGLEALASVSNAGWGEVSVHAALFPTARGAEFVPCWNAGRLAGKAFAAGWLERRKSCRLQASTYVFRCQRDALAILAAASIEPNGFAFHGQPKPAS